MAIGAGLVVAALATFISLSEATSDPASSQALPQYASQLYDRIREEAGQRYRTTLSTGQFRFGSNYPENEILHEDGDEMAMQGVHEQNSWQPFKREVSQLKEGATALMYTGKVTTIRVANTAADSGYLQPAVAQSLDLFHFVYAQQEGSGSGDAAGAGGGDGGINNFQSVYLDFWWSGLNGTAASSVDADATLEFQLDLRRGERHLRTTVKTFPLAQLPRGGEWLSVDMTAALQVWRVFVGAASEQEPATLSANGATARLGEFAVSMFIYRNGGDDDDDNVDGVRTRTSPLDLHAVVIDDADRRPLLTLMEAAYEHDRGLELSEEGIRYLRAQEHEHRERRRRSPETEPRGPPWADGQTWIPNRSRSCQLFQYSIPSGKFLGNVVEPTNIPLNLCYGICKVPFHAHTNASTHATLTEIWKQKLRISERRRGAGGGNPATPVDSRPQPETECVPVGFQPMGVLYSKTVGLVTEMKAELISDLSANSCGCR